MKSPGILVEGELDELKDVFVFDRARGRYAVYAECNILET